ncbi:MAG TPA: serine/threonine protein kinase [Pseudomonadales bacterium]
MNSDDRFAEGRHANDLDAGNGSAHEHPFATLSPDWVLSAVESTGRLCDGRMLALNSYENRVYQVGIEEGEPLIVKFYRPQRWTREQILEEHGFMHELDLHELPVVAPIADADGRTLQDFEGFMFALFPRRGGRSPDLDLDTLQVIGRTLGKLHGIGAGSRFRHRARLGVESFAEASATFLLERDFIPADLRKAYETLARDLIRRVKQVFAERRYAELRIHGDCHPGNVLWRDDIPYLVDFDDTMTGPAVQDLWMLLSGTREQQLAQLSELIDGYDTFHSFAPAELGLIEALRTLRLMHYSAWLARRWDDPAFPRSFPWFNTPRYWSQHVLELREQLAALDEPPLVLY